MRLFPIVVSLLVIAGPALPALAQPKPMAVCAQRADTGRPGPADDAQRHAQLADLGPPGPADQAQRDAQLASAAAPCN
jgi:hypothetical protein